MLFEWLEVFDKQDFMLVNANAFEDNPLDELYFLEDFLALRPFYEESKLSYKHAEKVLYIVINS